MDSLYRVFAQAKTDSAKLEASFEILQNLAEYDVDGMKKWIDTTAGIVAEIPRSRLAFERELYLARWNISIGDYEEGFRLSIQSAGKFKELRDSVNQTVALFQAGTALAEFNPKAGISVLEEAVELSKRIHDESLTARCVTNLGYAMEMAKLNTTVAYRNAMKTALEVFDKTKATDGILITNFNLVEYYISQGQLDSARQCIEHIQRTIKDDPDELNHTYPLVCEANVLMAEGRVDAAIAKYEAGWKLLDKYGVVDGRMELYPNMIEAYAKSGNYKKAYEFLNGFKVMRDSMVSLEKNKTVQNLQTRYETAKKEARIAAQQIDLARSRREKWALAAGLALLGGLAVMFWRQRRKILAVNLELAASHEQVQLKNQKLDLLMRELHHRVKNNLQLVSSLLRLQSKQMSDESAAAAIKAGQLRVEAMSLIHQRLYRQEGITLVNMQDFTLDLVEKIAFAFGFGMEAFDHRIEFEPQDLDVDKAMPISLILNELLTNSFKYAFGKTPRPKIAISLQPQGGNLRLHFADNGSGLPEEPGRASAFGSKLIASLSGQLGGEARQWNQDGAHFELVFPV